MHTTLHTKIHTQKGFSLVEMMVAVTLFMIVMIVAIGGLMMLVYSGSTTQSVQSVSANLSLAVDSMTRNIRTGYGYYCSSALSGTLPSTTNDCSSGGTGIVFTDSRTGDRTAFRYNSTDKSIEQKVESGAWRRMTAEEINVDALTFYVTGSNSSDALQGTVRILVRAISEQGNEVMPFYLQTLVTSRLLDV